MPRPITERADIVAVLGEVFRTHGYEGTSLALITQATGLGKGSLYHFFPGGKEEMAAAVLAEIDGWFEANVFTALRDDPSAAAITAMFDAVDRYFHSGGRVCLVGVFALSDTRDRFAQVVRNYFAAWIEALAAALQAYGHAKGDAHALAVDITGGIQGALVLARASDDAALFSHALARLKVRAIG